MTPLKPLRPPWFFPAIAAAHVQSSRAFFALAFEDALHVTAPSVIRNGCPPKKVGASTCSSSGPAMKACLVFNDGQIGPPALAHDPGPPPSRTLAPAPLDQVQRQQRDRDEEEVQHHEKLDRAHSRRAQINDVCSYI